LSFFAEQIWLPDGITSRVRIEMEAGRITALTPGSRPDDSICLPGVVLPGFANAHSHAFHRALRGRTHDDGGTFWTWRERMYSVARRLDPDSYLALARATYAEMALAGITSVGEFHYLHNSAAGRRYDDPNAMGEALRQAAHDAGIRLTLLDTCYLAGGLPVEADGHGPDGHLELNDVQRRFADPDVDAWAERAGARGQDPATRLGFAIHSVRAVPQRAIPAVTKASGGSTLHVHLSEQPAENAACRSRYGCSPTELLHRAGALTPHTTVVHATHLSPADMTTLARSGAGACFCPTTERDLGDGIGPSRALFELGVPLSLGSDQHAVVDLIEEARTLEMHERLDSLERGRFRPAEMLAALTNHAAIGWPDGGRIAVGARADLVAVRTDSVRMAGCSPRQILFAATAADVDTVIVDGQVVVSGGRHRLGDVALLLEKAISPLWEVR